MTSAKAGVTKAMLALAANSAILSRFIVMYSRKDLRDERLAWLYAGRLSGLLPHQSYMPFAHAI
jgi:hypothetical protein